MPTRKQAEWVLRNRLAGRVFVPLIKNASFTLWRLPAYSHEHGILGTAGPSIFWLTPSHHTVYPELDWFRLLEIQVFALTARQDYGGSNGKSSIGFAPRFRNRICR
jgi:hypothetical protein